MLGISKSKASQTTTTVADQGQNIGKSAKIAQGQGVLLDLKNVNTGVNIKNLGKDNVISFGDGGASAAAISEGLGGLTSSLTSATSAQIKALTEAGKEQTAQLAELLAQRQDTSAGNPKLLIYLAGAAFAALLLFAWILKK